MDALDRDPERDPREGPVRREIGGIGAVRVVPPGERLDVGEGPGWVVVDGVDVTGQAYPRVAVGPEHRERQAAVAPEVGRPEAADPAVDEDPAVILEPVPDHRLARGAIGVDGGDHGEERLVEKGSESGGQGRGEEGHKGKGFVLEARAARGDNGVYVRWFMFGGNHADLDMLEASLINYLNPLANDRDDDTRHPVLTRRDQLDSRLLG